MRSATFHFVGGQLDDGLGHAASGWLQLGVELLEHALQLPKEQRLRLADLLLDSVDEFSQTDDGELDPELREELVRRLTTIEDGTAVLLDGNEVMRELRAKYVR